MLARPQAFVRAFGPPDARLEFWCAARLESPNRITGRLARSAAVKTWTRILGSAVGSAAGWSLVAGDRLTRTGRRVEVRRAERRAVAVQILVPHARHFLRDDDNLRFTTKPLNDALVALGLLTDDSRVWLDQAMPAQAVSDDRRFWTVVTLRRLGADPGAR